MLSVCFLPATSSGVDSTNFSPPFKRVDTARSAKSMLLMLMLMLEKLKRFASLFSFCLFQFLRFTGSCLCLSLLESAGHKGKWGNHKAWLTSSQHFEISKQATTKHFRIFKQTTTKHFKIFQQTTTKHVKIIKQTTTKHCQTHITQEVGVFVWTSLQC